MSAASAITTQTVLRAYHSATTLWFVISRETSRERTLEAVGSRPMLGFGHSAGHRDSRRLLRRVR